MSAAANNIPPKWMMLERFVSRRDDDESFPDESKAPIRTSGTTSWNAPFSVAFKLAEPPAISRLYAYLPGFPGEPGRQLLSILSTHQHLALFRVGKISVRGELPVQDLFIFNASDLSLKLLPHCTLSNLGDHAHCDGRATPSSLSATSCAGSTTTVASSSVTCSIPPLLSPWSASLWRRSSVQLILPTCRIAGCNGVCPPSTPAQIHQSRPP